MKQASVIVVPCNGEGCTASHTDLNIARKNDSLFIHVELKE